MVDTIVNNYVDLHLHSTASDGVSSPAELVKLAKAKGFTAIAITDHDTTAGINEAMAEGKRQNLEVVPGIELSTLWGEREIHLLGYYLDWNDHNLQQTLSQMIEARQTRAARMVEKLNTLGIAISLARVKEIAGSEFIGRPHIAQALLERNYVKDTAEAFTADYIGRGGRGYVERFKITPAEGIDLLTQAAAVPVLAHPGFLSRGIPVTEAEILKLVKAGLRGIEVYYSRHSQEQVNIYRAMALKHNLLITGGSDCHKYDEAISCLGSIKLPYQYLSALKEAKRYGKDH